MSIYLATKIALWVFIICILSILVASQIGCGDDDSGFVQRDPVIEQQNRIDKYTIYKGERMVELDLKTPADLIERISNEVCRGPFQIAVSDYRHPQRLLVTCTD